MGRDTTAREWGAAMWRAISPSTEPGADQVGTGRCAGASPADAEGPDYTGGDHAVINRTHACTSH